MSWEDVAIDENGRTDDKDGQSEDFAGKKVTAALRTSFRMGTSVAVTEATPSGEVGRQSAGRSEADPTREIF